MGTKPPDELSTEVRLENKMIGSARARAGGLYGGALLCAFIVLLVFLVGDHTKPPHYLISVISAFFGGVFFATVVADNRVKVALALVEEKRQEITRIAKEKAALEEKFVQRRLSSSSASLPPTPPSSAPALPPSSSTVSSSPSVKKKAAVKKPDKSK